MATDVRAVLVTAPDASTAERLASTLVEEGLAACVNVVPGVVSIYRWKDGVQRDAEVLLVAKCPARGFEALRRRVVELHPYELPEVLSLPVEEGHAPYLAWVLGEEGA